MISNYHLAMLLLVVSMSTLKSLMAYSSKAVYSAMEFYKLFYTSVNNYSTFLTSD